MAVNIAPRTFGWTVATVFLAAISRSANAVQSVVLEKSEAVPCSGLQNELIRHSDVVACRGSWSGNIATKATHICTNGWNVCTWENVRTLSQISWYEATHISGCYAVNAVHDGSHCSPCLGKSPAAEMAAVGADCVAYNKSSTSCFGDGRIDASYSGVRQYTPCHHAPWITGVLCCRNGSERAPVNVISDVIPSNDIMQGTRVVLRCRATVSNPVQYSWYRDHHLVKVSRDNGTLVIGSVSSIDSGSWRCLAVFSRGSKLSSSIQLRVRKRIANKTTVGCRNSSDGRILESSGGSIALCRGVWKGHVRKASKTLCGAGWKVCTNKNRFSLYSVLWNEVSAIKGCYAYDAASTTYYPCTRCSPKHEGNRMAGIGGGCLGLKETGYSCLGQKRIDVYTTALSGATPKPKRTLRACRHTAGVTTGVACCKRLRRGSPKKRKGNKECKCKPNGVCARRGYCKCKAGYKGKRCQYRVSDH